MKIKLFGFPGWVDIPFLLLVVFLGRHFEYSLGFIAFIALVRMALSVLVVKVPPSMLPRVLTYFLLMVLISLVYFLAWGGGDLRSSILFYLGIAACSEILYTIIYARWKANK